MHEPLQQSVVLLLQSHEPLTGRETPRAQRWSMHFLFGKEGNRNISEAAKHHSPPKNVTFRGNHEGLCPSPAACSRRALLSPSFPTFQFSPNFRRPLTRSGRPTSNLGCATHRAEKLLIPVSGNRDIFIRRALLKF